MAEYIEREAAIKATCFNCSEKAICGGVCDDTDRIRSIPAADVRPVVRGRWEEDWAGAAVCSVCSEYAFETSTHHLCGWFPNYCPNCGADMREES